MNFQSKVRTNPEILNKIHRPQAIIPYRDPPVVDHFTSIQNANISPMPFTPKIHMKGKSKLSPTEQHSTKRPILPNINKSRQEEGNTSPYHGGSEESKTYLYPSNLLKIYIFSFH